MLGGAGYGIMLFAVQTVTAIVVGIVISRAARGKSEDHKARRILPDMHADMSTFPEAISEAVPCMLTVCGSVIFFSAFTEAAIAPIAGFLPDAVSPLLSGFFEMSRGIAQAASSLPEYTAVPVISAISAWSGISVHMQITAFTHRSGISLKKYYIAKSVSALICPAAAYAAGKIFELI